MAKTERNLPGWGRVLLIAASAAGWLGCKAAATNPQSSGAAILGEAGRSSAGAASVAGSSALAANAGISGGSAGAGAGGSSDEITGTFPAMTECAITAPVCATVALCPAVQLCASVPLVSQVDLDRTQWTGHCVPSCNPDKDNEFGCNWQQERCPAGYKCLPCDRLK